MIHSPLSHLPSVFRKQWPLQLTFFVTRKCNARCPFCFYLAGAEGEPDQAEELSFAEIEAISHSLGRMLWVVFSGGEPFLRRDLAEISKVFHDRNKPSFLLYPTNGLLPDRVSAATEEILRTCPNSIIAVKISIDGIGARHDDLRKTPGGFDKALETYRRLDRLRRLYPNLELGINTVFCSENQDQMDAIIDAVRDWEGDKTHTISMVRGDLADRRYKNVDIGAYGRAIGRLEAGLRNGASDMHRFRGGRLKASQDILQRRLILRVLYERRRVVPCYAGKLNLVLGETGEVYPCEIRRQSLGNVRSYGHDMRKLLRSRNARAGMDVLNDIPCHCTHECNFITNILFNLRLYPALLREYTKLAKGGSAGSAPGIRPVAAE